MAYGRYSDAYSNMAPYVERAPTVRAAMYLAPAGLGFLMLSAFVASAGWVCTEGCVREAEDLDERVLDCEESCKNTRTKYGEGVSDCKTQCLEQTGYTANRVRTKQQKCTQACAKSPFLMHVLAFFGTTAMLAVTPLLGSYKGSCRCECCIGEGCSGRLALLNVAWVLYGFSCLWVPASVAEDTSSILGKVFFALMQGISTILMLGSRNIADEASVRPVQGVPPGGELGAIVGAPVHATTLELQGQVKELQQQVRDLVRLQTLQLQAAASTAVPEAPAAAPAAPPAPSAVAPPPAPKELL